MGDFGFRFDNSYARDLPGMWLEVQAAPAPQPALIRLNTGLARSLGLDPEALSRPEGISALGGQTPPKGAQPLAMAYAGHQFGGFSPQLGDGRALLLGEQIAPDGRRVDIHLKGSGRTPFSRGGDGKAVLGPVLREYLMGEAMEALGIPTTRALAALATGETVWRDGPQAGAVLVRVAASHLRVGTFQFFAARGETERVARLVDHAVARHDPDLTGAPDRAPRLLQRVCARQAELVAGWMSVGFVHGVMNTDNMAISGETIDYGPCAFLDAYHPQAVFSSIDQTGRYAFANQPLIARWNLARLAEALLDQFGAASEEAAIALATEAVMGFDSRFRAAHLARMRAKLGLAGAEDADEALVADLMTAMADGGADFTLTFRHLARAAAGDAGPLRSLFADGAAISAWLARWQARLSRDAMDPNLRPSAMDAVNPARIPRNHLVEEALTAAATGDMAPFDGLLKVLAAPFVAVAGEERYTLPAPAGFGPYRTFCGT